MEGREAMERFERSEEAAEARERFGRHSAIVVAVLAAMLAIASLAGNKAEEDVILSQAKATDAYNEYQANSLKRHVNENDSALLKILSAGGPQAQAAQAQAAKLDQAVAEKYRPNQNALLPKAREFEAERDRAETRHRDLQVAEAAFQIGIVLTSIAIVARTAALVYAGAGLGALGLLLLLNGFLGWVRLPTLAG